MWSKRLRRVAANGGRTTLRLAPSAGLITGSMLGVTGNSAVAAGKPTYLDPHASVSARVDDLLGRMTLAQKIGQMTQIEVSRVVGDCNNGPGPLTQACAQNVLGTDA